MLIREQKQTGRTETQSFKIQKSKPIIEEIDRLLATHYGLTQEELEFIINYDIKYRMGLEAESEREEWRAGLMTLPPVNAGWPEKLAIRLGETAPHKLRVIGPTSLLALRKTALFCSPASPERSSCEPVTPRGNCAMNA